VPLGLAIFGGVMRQLFWTMREPARDAEAYASMPICVNR
jgi:hypothetical protein